MALATYRHAVCWTHRASGQCATWSSEADSGQCASRRHFLRLHGSRMRLKLIDARLRGGITLGAFQILWSAFGAASRHFGSGLATGHVGPQRRHPGIAAAATHSRQAEYSCKKPSGIHYNSSYDAV
ncbi:hypothetical protein [Aminobacter sp. HY435]|uniref:hypothetical protein n=1 Tax=Aminobacter sp. HY435 TaxID=2970917 RepID=UPI0022B9BC08|nr:hypothetical protein [Aminobacter sp. HY435]